MDASDTAWFTALTGVSLLSASSALVLFARRKTPSVWTFLFHKVLFVALIIYHSESQGIKSIRLIF